MMEMHPYMEMMKDALDEHSRNELMSFHGIAVWKERHKYFDVTLTVVFKRPQEQHNIELLAREALGCPAKVKEVAGEFGHDWVIYSRPHATLAEGVDDAEKALAAIGNPEDDYTITDAWEREI